MASEVHSGKGTAAETPQTEIPATPAVETDRTVEAAPEPVAVRPMVTELAPVAETTIPIKTLPETAAETPQTETEFEIPAALEKEAVPVPVDDQPTVTKLPPVGETKISKKKWTGWPGDCVFRVVVPVLKAGSIIGRNEDLIMKMCKETKAHIRVLDGPACDPHRIFLISGKEEREAPVSPAMDAVIKIFKLVNGFPENESDGVASIPFSSVMLLVPSMQAMSLIGKQGLIHENTGCCVRLLSTDEASISSASSDDRVVDLQGKAHKLLQALEYVLGHLRMFLVDHSIRPFSEQTQNSTITQEKCQVVAWAEKSMQESQFSSSGLSLFGRDPGLIIRSSPGFDRTAGPCVTQVSQSIKISAVDAIDIIGVGGENIVNIGRTSGAILTVHEIKGVQNEITFEIKGSSSQVQTAQRLIQAKTGGDRAIFGPTVDRAVPAALNTSTFQPPDRTQPAFSHSLTVPRPLRRKKRNRHKHIAPAMRSLPHVTVPSTGTEIGESKRSKVGWENENVVKTFLDACIHEIGINGREDGGLKQASWKQVGEKLKEFHNFSVDFKQMKNHFDDLKNKYTAWLKLKNKTNTSYDPSTDTFMFNFMDTKWKNPIQGNKYVYVRNTSLPFPDLCAKLFDGAISTGLKIGGPSSAKPIPTIEPQMVDKDEPIPTTTEHHIVKKAEPTPTIEPYMVEKDEPQPTIEPPLVQKDESIPIIEPYMVEKDEPIPTIGAHTVENDRIQKDTISLVSSSSSHPFIENKQKEGEKVFEKEMLGVLRMIADKMNKPEPPPKPTFEDCEEKLKKLGWPKNDRLNVVAYGIFCDENDRYRECWMKLKPEMCANWVLMIGRSKGFIF